MSKRTVRKTIQGKQLYKDHCSQTGVEQPPEEVTVRNGFNFLQHGVNLMGMAGVNPLLQMGADLVADVLSDNPIQSPVQTMKKDENNPVKNSILKQVQDVQEQVQDMVQKHVTIKTDHERSCTERSIAPEIVPDVMPNVTIETSNPSKTEIREKYQWVPTISREVVVDVPEKVVRKLKPKIKERPRISQRHVGTKTIHYTSQQQQFRNRGLVSNNVSPMFGVPKPEQMCTQMAHVPKISTFDPDTIGPPPALESNNPYKDL